MALVAVALTDAYIAVFDAKYRHECWRPVTAIRNGDIDANSGRHRGSLAADRHHADALRMSVCALHRERRSSRRDRSDARSRDIPEVSLSSMTLPGITHRWTNLDAFADEVANSRILAGFHYRFSTRVGTAMGNAIGQYAMDTVMQPVTALPSLSSRAGE
jgi:hypothetical protein